MAFEDGWAAMNLEMPSRVPRTEYSAQQHYELVSAVTGITVGVDSTGVEKERASKAFAGPDGWNFDLTWSTLIGRGDLGNHATSMGHAVYAAGGTDYDTDIHEAFASPEEALAFQPMDALPNHNHSDLVRRFEAHYQSNKANNPETVNMTGTYITCVSGLIDLFGWEMLLTACGIDPEAFGALTNRYAAWMQQ